MQNGASFDAQSSLDLPALVATANVIDNIAYRTALHYTIVVIKSFRHKGIERFFKNDDARGINAKHGPRIRRMLDLIDQASAVEQLDIPGMHLHQLKFDRKGEWAMTVSGNWRITFRFVGEDATNVNLEDYH